MSDMPAPPPAPKAEEIKQQLAPLLPAKKRRLWWISLVGLGVVLLAVGAFLVLHKKPTPKPATSTTTAAATASIPPAAQDVPNTTATTPYHNDNLNLDLTIPSNWTTTPTDNGSAVRIESPQLTYPTVAKGNVTGVFRIYIRQGARAVDSKYIGRGVTIEPSQKLVYTKPASSQRSETNLSLFGLDTADNFAFFLIAGNFSLQANETLGPNYGKEAETFIIGGGYTSSDLPDDLATNPVPPAYLKDSNAFKQAKSILASLQLH